MPVYLEIKSVVPQLQTNTGCDSRRYAQAIVRNINNALFDCESLQDLLKVIGNFKQSITPQEDRRQYVFERY